MKARRYENLVREIHRVRPARILEIGTCKGERAELMIRAASVYGEVEYYGFDLFAPPAESEFSARAQPWGIGEVSERLAPLSARVSLYPGDTRETLAPANLPMMNLIFIDGGHSDETVKSDFWNCVRIAAPGAPIILDDYWNYPGGGGCNALVDGLDRVRFQVVIMPPVDVFKKPYGELRTQMVRVIERA